MDKIIEEYITLDFINNEMLFNKQNYMRMIKIRNEMKEAEEEPIPQPTGFGRGDFQKLAMSQLFGPEEPGVTSPPVQKQAPSEVASHLSERQYGDNEDRNMPYIQINGKNFEALNFNDQRTSAILKQALRIEEDQKDRFQKFKAQKISPAVCQMNKIKLNFRERIEKMNNKLEKINKLKKMTQTKMMFEKFASKSQVSANKENKDSTG